VTVEQVPLHSLYRKKGPIELKPAGQKSVLECV
jgi:hypothetical protein